MQQAHKFEINALNVIKSVLIIITLSSFSSSGTSNSNRNSHSKNNNDEIASMSTFDALEQMLYSGSKDNNNSNNSKNNSRSFSNINYDTTKQETETKIKIERYRSRQHGRTNNNNNNNINNNTNYTPMTKINEIIKNVQSADYTTTVLSSTPSTTTILHKLTLSPSSTQIRQSTNELTTTTTTTAATISWSSVTTKRIVNSNSKSIANVNSRRNKTNKTDVRELEENKILRALQQQMRLLNRSDAAVHGKQQQQLYLNSSFPLEWNMTKMTVKKRQRNKRFIIFDGNGVVKLIIGGSIPIKLISKQRSLTGLFNIQMQYIPPPTPLYWWSFYNTTTFAARTSELQTSLQLTNDASRTFVYAIIEKILKSKGIPGTECLLKAICIMAQQPLTDGNLFHEILNAIFIPIAANIDTKYLDAQAAGRCGVDCAQTFAKCPTNISWLNSVVVN